MEHNNVFMKWIDLALSLLIVSLAQTQVLQHVEPANWWVGMEQHQVQVLLHGPQIAKYKVEIGGLQILEEIRTENPNYIFVLGNNEKTTTENTLCSNLMLMRMENPVK